MNRLQDNKTPVGYWPKSSGRRYKENELNTVASGHTRSLVTPNAADIASLNFSQDKQAAKALRTEMKAADTNQDGMISFIEFLGYFQKMARYQADLARTQRLESYGRPRELPHCEFCSCPALPRPALPRPAPIPMFDESWL